MARFVRRSAVVGAVLAGLAALACEDRTQGERGQNQPAQGARTPDAGQLAGTPAGLPPAEQARATKEVAGTLTRAATDQVVIRSDAHGDLTLRVNDGTRITVDGQPASPDRLREGVEVRAAYETGNGGRPTATFIQAESAEAASARTVNKAHGGTGYGVAGPGIQSGPSPSDGGRDVNAEGEKKE